MIPTPYQLPAAVVLIVGGTISCFFGYRLFRIVLAIAGFILGWAFASSLFGASDTGLMIGAGVLGGLAGAGLLIAAYFVGVALVGAGLGVLVAHLMSSALGTEPGFLLIVLCSVIGAVGSMYLQRYVIVIGTAFGGSMTLIDGVMAALGNRAAAAAALSGDIWVFYPTNPAPGQRWVVFAWLILGAIGMAAQLGWSGGAEKVRVIRRRRKKVVEA